MSVPVQNSFHGKVLLFFPPDRQLTKEQETMEVFPAPRLSLGLASIAMYLRHHAGIAAYVYCSTDHSPQELEKIIRSEKPAVIGIACWSYNRFACFALARIAKRIDPKIVIVFGGVHATFLDRQILAHYPEVDYVMRGEGEITFLKLLAALGRNRDIASIDGLTFRRDGEIVRTSDRQWCKTLDDLPLIDYKTISIGTPQPGQSVWRNSPVDRKKRMDQLTTYQMNRTLPVETSRGCPYSCKYCSSFGFMGRGVARRSVDKVIKQIGLILEADSDGMHFHDMNFTLNRQYTVNLCKELIRHKIKTPWTCMTRIDLVDKELLILLRQAGCEGIFLGVESLSKNVLSSIGRKYTPSFAIDYLNLTASLGIKAQMNIIIGFPGETDRDRVESLRNSIKIHKDINVLVQGLLIFPGAEIYEMALRDGFDESYWLSEHEEVFPFFTGTLSKDEMLGWIKRLESGRLLKQRLLKIAKERTVSYSKG